MNDLENDLRVALRQRVESRQVKVPPTGELALSTYSGDTRGPRRATWLIGAAAAVLALALVSVALLGGSGSPDETRAISDGDPAEASEPVGRELEAQLHQWQADNAASCEDAVDPNAPPPTTQEDPALSEPVLVGTGPGCAAGLIDPEYAYSLDPELVDDLAPITDPDTGDVIGYWAQGVGWLTEAQVEHPDFDLARLQTIAEGG